MNKEKKLNMDLLRSASEGLFGNITAIARRMNLSRSTLYDFIAENPEAKRWIESQREEFDDLAEHVLQKKILDGDKNMLRFYASTKLKNRGYVKDIPKEEAKEGEDFSIFLKIKQEN